MSFYLVYLSILLNIETMKKIYSFFVFFGLAFYAHAQFPAPYCPISFPSGVEPITLVQFAGIDNSNPAATSGASAHIDFTAVSGTVNTGDSYPVTVNGNTDGGFTNHITVFIDWNQDGNFDGPNEVYQIGSINNNPGTGTPATGTIAVPADAFPGPTRMRVTKRFNVPATACGSAGYGQAQDFTVNVNAGDPCDAIPTIGAATASVTATCVNSPVVLNAEITPMLGYSYQWESSIDAGTTWNALGNPQTSAAYTVDSQTVASSYRLVVTCTAVSLSATSTPVDVAQNPTSDCYCSNDINFVCDSGDLILNVTFGSINNESTCSIPTGYSDFTSTVTPAQIEAGTTENISVTVGPSGDGWLLESVGVWIDFNQNGVFEDSEYTYVGTGLNEALTKDISIPSDAVEGITRMRVVVSAAAASSFGPQFNCGPVLDNNPYGEMEDYAIEITPALSLSDQESSKFTMHPNPTNGMVTISFKNPKPIQTISVYSITGQLIISKPVQSISNQYNLDLNNTANGIYIIKIQTEDGLFVQQLVKK